MGAGVFNCEPVEYDDHHDDDVNLVSHINTQDKVQRAQRNCLAVAKGRDTHTYRHTDMYRLKYSCQNTLKTTWK